MIVIRLIGGIGNQLFIYAFARSLELKYKIQVYLDVISGYKNDPYKKKYELDKFNIKIKKASTFDFYYFPLRKRFPLLTKLIYPGSDYIQENISEDFDPSILNEKSEKKIYMEGYWQQPSYFMDYLDVIREELKIISSHKKENIKLDLLIKENQSVGIHIRRKNFEPVVPLRFYEESIDSLTKKLANPLFFCFSDDIEWCKKNLKSSKPIYFVENNQAEQTEDLWLFTKCSYFIISNSTFSWWASQLAYNTKRIIFPEAHYWDSKSLIEAIQF